MSNRRDFLKASGMAIMAGSMGFVSMDSWLRGAPAPVEGSTDGGSADPERQRPTLVTIFLRGGADSLNAIVPIGDPKYYEYRPNIAIPAKAAKGEDLAAIPFPKQKDTWGLNPGFKSLMPLIEAGMCVPILNVGSPNGTRSHFSAQDYMERGTAGDARVTQGWLNRYLELSKKPYDAPLRGISAMSLLPRALRGNYPVLAGNNRCQDMALFENLYATENMVNMTAREGANTTSGSSLTDRPGSKMTVKHGLNADAAREIITDSGANAVARLKALEKAERMPNSAAYPGGGLGSQLATIAKVIKANMGLEVAQADYGGWDHHSGQGGVKGAHTNMLRHLSDCLVAFNKDLGEDRMKKVMVLVMSEFGRTVQENGTNGTDHGNGGFMLVMGGMVAGPKVFGQFKGMGDLNYDRFMPVHTDFRTVFAESISKLFHFDPFKAKMFPGYNGNGSEYINFLKQLKEV